MKNIATICALIIIFLATSCQKELSFDKKEVEPVHKSSLVRNSVYKKGNTLEEYNYEYDEKGRIIRAISPLAGGSKIFYKYNADNTYTMDKDDSSASAVHELNFVNNLGYLDSTVSSTNTSKVAYKYVYSNKLMTQFKEYNIVNSTSALKNTTFFEYDLNNDLVKEKNSNNDVQIIYTYYSSVNTLNNGFIYHPPVNHLVKTSTFTGSRVINATLTHTYTFDSYNRITSETVVDNNGNNVISRKYKYD